MAAGVSAIGNLPGRVNSAGALIVSSAGTGGTGGGTGPILMLQGTTAAVDSLPALLIIFV